MKRHALTVALLLWPAIALADPPQLVIAPEIPATAGDWIVITPTTTAKAVVFIGLDGLSSFPSSELKDPRKLVVNPQKDGRYRFLAVGTLNDEMTVTPFAVVVGARPDPGPNPSPPPPNDPLLATLRDAYAAEADPQKAAQKAALAAVFGDGAGFASAVTTATYGQLFKLMADSANARGVAGKLTKVQDAVAASLKGTLPTDPAAPLDAAGRARASAGFTRIKALLESIP